MAEKKTLTVLGSTGSIGTQALEVAEANGFSVAALCAGRDCETVERQARKFRPEAVAMADASAAAELKIRLADTPVRVLSGAEGVRELATLPSADTVLNAIVGIAGLAPTMAAIEAGKDVALANKETIVTAGELVMRAAARKGVKILPVDSEHSAIFQCLQGAAGNPVEKIILTASGGPFFGKTAAELENVTPAEALRHPNWNMGAKITVDSATLMNKGLEVIEAVHLFGIKPERIDIIIHRESVIHSAVEFADGAVIAQLGTPDMKLPIQYALTYPKRLPCASERLDLKKLGKLTFFEPDTETFGCLKTCIDAVKAGGLKPAAANGANELAVELFLKGEIGFMRIADLVRGAAEAQPATEAFTLEDIFAANLAAREYVLRRKK